MWPEKKWEPAQLLMLGMLVFLSFAGAVLASAIVYRLTKGHLSIHGSTLVTAIIGVLGFQGAAVVWVHFFLKQHGMTWGEAFGFARGNHAQCLGAALVALPVVWVTTLGLSKMSELILNRLHAQMQWDWLKPELQPMVQLLQREWPVYLLLVQAFLAIVVAPLGEEILFRGVIYTAIKQRGHRIGAVCASALLFALIHSSPVNLISLLFLALVLVALYERTRNLLAPILLHSLFNAVNFVLILNPEWAERVFKRWMNWN